MYSQAFKPRLKGFPVQFADSAEGALKALLRSHATSVESFAKRPRADE
jgi:hypothetical protein